MKTHEAFDANWSPFLPLTLVLFLVLFFRFYFPIIFPVSKAWSLELTTLSCALVLIGLGYSKDLSIKRILLNKASGIRGWGPGLFLGLVVVSVPPLADLMIELTGLSRDPLFSGAEGRVLDVAPMGTLEILQVVLFKPFLGQIMFLGLCLAPCKKKIGWGIFLGVSGLGFMLVLWDFSAASLLIGVVSGLLFSWTGSLFSGIIFQAMSGIAGLLLLNIFPRTITLMAFLF